MGIPWYQFHTQIIPKALRKGGACEALGMDNEASSVDVAVSGICCNEQRSAAKHPRRFTSVGPMRISHVVMTCHDHIAQRCVEM